MVDRYGPRNNIPPGNYPPMGVKPIPQLMNMSLPPDLPPPGYRGRYDGPPFDAGPPGVEPPVPGFEPPPFEKPPFGPPLAIDRDRLAPPFRDPYGPRPPTYEGPGGFREMPLPVPTEIQVHVGEARFRDNFRQGPPTFRDQGPVQFRDGQPFRDSAPQLPYRDPNFRSGVPTFREGPYRNVPFRESGFRENPPHGSFRDGPPVFRPPTSDIRDPREPVPPNFHDPNYRDSYRDETGAPRDARPGYRTSVRSRGAPRRHPNVEHEKHREREGREREGRETRDGNDRDRYVEPSERVERGRDAERIRDPERKPGREGRSRDERNRDYEKEKDHERLTPDKKSRSSPKRIRETRDKRRSESKGRSRDRETKRDKKEDRSRDKSSPDRVKEHKDKDKKIKDRKKKKREKEKDGEKKKKREKKEKRDKDIKKDEEVANDEETEGGVGVLVKEKSASEDQIPEHKVKLEKVEETDTNNDKTPKTENEENQNNDLYGDESAETVDQKIIESYVKTEEGAPSEKQNDSTKEEPFDGIELQANTDELDLKPEPEVTNSNREMLAPLPELSKWEVDDDHPEKIKEPGEITSPETEEDGGKVTSDVIKRAENAIFAKAINSLRPIEIKKISSDRIKLYGDDPPKPINNIQITVPIAEADQISVDLNEKKPRYSKTPPPRLSVKERLGGKVDNVRRAREPRVVHSTVELVKSRSKTPKKDQPYRRVTVEKDKGRRPDGSGRPDSSKPDRGVSSENAKGDKRRGRSPHDRKNFDKNIKGEKKKHESAEPRARSYDKKTLDDAKGNRERKKSTLDEANFVPDYDETLESDIENKTESVKKRERSFSPPGNEQKKPKMEAETIKLDLTNVKKKPDSDSESSSGSGDSSSSSSSGRKKKKKKKRSKKKKKRAASESDSESDSSQDDHKKKKKKRKHKKKSSKKKSKKSKHK